MRSRPNPLMCDLVEVAMEAPHRDSFRQDTLELVIRAAGADAGSFCSKSESESDLAAALVGAESAIEPIAPCVSQIALAEFERALAPRAQVDTEVVTAARRERLLLYRHYLPSLGVRRYVIRAWRRAQRVHWLTLARTGRHDEQRFLGHAAALLDSIFPLIVLGERAQLEPGGSEPEGAMFDPFSPAERRVAALLERGLTNREIAELVGVSANTVRNRVASAFRKIGAGRRAEFVYLMRSGGERTR
jgi:DNA-binding CsgD family transcriptional regulator